MTDVDRPLPQRDGLTPLLGPLAGTFSIAQRLKELPGEAALSQPAAQVGGGWQQQRSPFLLGLGLCRFGSDRLTPFL